MKFLISYPVFKAIQLIDLTDLFALYNYVQIYLKLNYIKNVTHYYYRNAN